MGQFIRVGGVAVAVMLGLSACQRSEAKTTQPAAAASGASDTVKGPGEAKIGDTTTCAVHRDHRIVVSASTPKVEYQGKTYYFCCPVCANKFAERPQDYVK